MVILPLFLLTIYIQLASQLHWDFSWLIALSPLLCLLSWIAGVLLTWKFAEGAWTRWLQHERWKTWRNCACITGGCALLVALVAMYAQVETVFTPKAYLVLSWIVMVANAYVLLVYTDLTKKHPKQAGETIPAVPVEQGEEKQV